MSFDAMSVIANLRKSGVLENVSGGDRLSAIAGTFGRGAGIGAAQRYSALFRENRAVPTVPVFKVPKGVISGLAGAGGPGIGLTFPKAGAGVAQVVGVGGGVKPLLDRMNFIAGAGVKSPAYKPPAWAGVPTGVPKEPLISTSPAMRMIFGLAGVGEPGKAPSTMTFPVIGAGRDGFRGTMWRFSGLREMKSMAVPDIRPGWLGKTGPGAPSFAARAAGIGGFEAGPLYGGWSGARKVVEDLARARDLLAPYRERWARLTEELAEWATREAAKTTPEDRFAAAAFEALEALEDGRHWETDGFLKRYLNIRPHPQIKPYVYQALWMLLRADFDRPFDSPAKWRTLELRKATAYLSTAIYNEARRLKRDADKLDELWWGKRAEPPVIVPEVFPTGEHGDPAEAVAELLDGRPPDDRVLVLESLSLSGTDGDREVARLVRGGAHDRAGIRNEVGSPRLQAFERKARRWRADGKY